MENNNNNNPKNQMSTEERMELIANSFGLELDEYFDVFNSEGSKLPHSPFGFTKKGLTGKYEECCNNIVLGYITTGHYTIKKLPWKPELGKPYHIPVITPSRFADASHEFIYTGSKQDKFYMEHNLMSETREETIEKRDKILKFCKEEL